VNGCKPLSEGGDPAPEGETAGINSVNGDAFQAGSHTRFRFC
jgi:hypothetical protein